MFYYTGLLIFKDGFSGAWMWLNQSSLGQRKSCQGLHVVQAPMPVDVVKNMCS